MSRTARLWVVLAADLALVAGLIVVGATAHSVGVWAEGADYAADAAAIGVALWAIRLARRPVTDLADAAAGVTGLLDATVRLWRR